MKNYIYIFIFLIITLQACTEMLEPEAYDAIPADQVLTNKKGLDGSLMGAYDILQSASIGDAIIFAELAADNFITVGSKVEYHEVNDNDIQSSNAYSTGIWNNSYEGINLVNYIIEGIEGIEGVTEDEKNNYLGQAYFLRAFHYFNLVRYFGDVPKRDKAIRDASPETLNISVSPKSEIYQFMIDDLQKAETYMAGTGSGNYAFVTEGAIKALLAKVYLYTEKWADAANKAQEVIDMGYTLEMTNYGNIFDEAAISTEIIFAANFANEVEASNYLTTWLSYEGRAEFVAWNNDKSETIYDEFETGDLRRNHTVQLLKGKLGDDYYCVKYSDIVNANDNTIFLRLAEMYLIRAEALNEVSYPNTDAFAALNTIRNRAGLSNLTTSELTSQAQFRLAVEKERRLELAFEGNRFFDLRRTGRIDNVLPDIGTLKANGWYFPIPQTEIDTNDNIN